MPPIPGLPDKLNLNYFHQDLHFLFTDTFKADYYIKVDDVEKAYAETFKQNYKDVLSMINRDENYIFEFVEKTYPDIFMPVPKPAQFPGFMKMKIMNMKQNFLAGHTPAAIEDGSLAGEHRDTTASPIVEEIDDAETVSNKSFASEVQAETSHATLSECEKSSLFDKGEDKEAKTQDEDRLVAVSEIEKPNSGIKGEIKTEVRSAVIFAAPSGYEQPSSAMEDDAISTTQVNDWKEVDSEQVENKTATMGDSFQIMKVISSGPSLSSTPIKAIIRESPPGLTTLEKMPPPIPDAIIRSQPGFSGAFADEAAVPISSGPYFKSVEEFNLESKETTATEKADVFSVFEEATSLSEPELAVETTEEPASTAAENHDFDEFFDADYLADDLNETPEPDDEKLVPAIVSDSEPISEIVTAPIQKLSPQRHEDVIETCDDEMNNSLDASSSAPRTPIEISESAQEIAEQESLEEENKTDFATEFFDADFIHQLNIATSEQPRESENLIPENGPNLGIQLDDSLEEGEIRTDDEDTDIVPVPNDLVQVEETNEVYNEFLDPDFLDQALSLAVEQTPEPQVNASLINEFFDEEFLAQQNNLNREFEDGELLNHSTVTEFEAMRLHSPEHSNSLKEVDPSNRSKINYKAKDRKIINYEEVNRWHQGLADNVYIPNENSSVTRNQWEKQIDNCSAILRLVQKVHSRYPVITHSEWAMIEEEFAEYGYSWPLLSCNIAGVEDLLRARILLLVTSPSGAKTFRPSREVIFMRFFPLPRKLPSNLCRLLMQYRKITFEDALLIYARLGGKAKTQEDKELEFLHLVNDFPEIFILEAGDDECNLQNAVISINERIPERDIIYDFCVHFL